MFDARWFTGVSSAERHAAGRYSREPSESDRRRGERWVGMWRDGHVAAAPAVDPARAFALPESAVTALAGEPPESLRDRLPAPGWLHVIREAWQTPDSDVADDPPGCWCSGEAAPDTFAPTSDEMFLAWIAPLTGWAVDDVQRRLRGRDDTRALADNPRFLSIDDGPLLTMIKPVLVHELASARDRGQLCGRTSRHRFRCFAAGLRRPDRGLAVLRRYPVLARELVSHLETWSLTRTELARRLLDDLPLLAEHFGVVADDIAGIVSLDADVGDPHRGGRGVVIVTMPGTTLVYKPRPLALEACLKAVAHLLNRRGLRQRVELPVTVNRGTYGWSAYVRWRPCVGDAALARFYWRMGAQLAIFHALRGYDLHMYNVIADGDQPVFVDVEAMFHAPADFEDVDDPHGEVIGPRIRESVLATLLLPQPQVVHEDDGIQVLDVSALAGGLDGYPRRLRPSIGYADGGTDRMRPVLVRHPMAAPCNLPFARQLAPRHLPIAEQVVAGFEECYRLLAAERDTLLSAEGVLGAIADVEVRSVLRSTDAYTTLLADSYRPDLLRDALDRECFLFAFADQGGLARHPEILRSEHRQLLGRDVPIFFARAGTTAVFDPDGVVDRQFFPRSGLDRVRARLQAMSEADLEQQVWYIRAALATVGRYRRPKGSQAGSVPVTPEAVVDAAKILADRIVATAERGETGGPEWVTVNRQDENTWTVGATTLGINTGVTGIALFLAELDAVVDDPRYRKTAEDVIAGLIEDEPPELEDLAGMNVGAFEDLGSVALTMARLGHLWSMDLVAPVRDWLPAAIMRNLGAGPAGDVERGAAGAVFALLALHGATGRPALLTAVSDAARAVVRIAATTVVSSGIGRGLPGCALALAAAGFRTGDGDLTRASRAVWGRGRARDAGQVPPGWRDGLAGDVLTAAAMRQMEGAVGAAELAADLHTAAVHLADRWRRDDAAPGGDSLGDGSLGTAYALRVAADATGDARLDEVATRMVGDVLGRVAHRDGPRTGVPGGVWTPGLLDGGSGIGYGLLSAAGVIRGPHVLTCYQR